LRRRRLPDTGMKPSALDSFEMQHNQVFGSVVNDDKQGKRTKKKFKE
jgi:hypothetical protein